MPTGFFAGGEVKNQEAAGMPLDAKCREIGCDRTATHKFVRKNTSFLCKKHYDLWTMLDGTRTPKTLKWFDARSFGK